VRPASLEHVLVAHHLTVLEPVINAMMQVVIFSEQKATVIQ